MKVLDKCLSKHTKNKVPGPGNTPAMMWKHPIFFCNEALNDILLSTFSKSSMFATPKERFKATTTTEESL